MFLLLNLHIFIIFKEGFFSQYSHTNIFYSKPVHVDPSSVYPSLHSQSPLAAQNSFKPQESFVHETIKF